MTRASGKHGSVLVAALLTLVILQLVIATMVLSGGRESDQTRSRWGQARSYYNAESAAAMSLRELKQSTDIDGDGTIGGVSDDGADANNPALNGGRLKASYTGGVITTNGSAITATRASAITVTMVSPGGPTRPGLYLEAWPLAGPTLVDAFDWAQTPETVGWVHGLYWPSQSSTDLMFVGQTMSAVRLTGKITAADDGGHAFAIDACDDVKLIIDGEIVLHADSSGACRRTTGSIKLSPGEHDFQILYTDGAPTGCLMAYWQPPTAPDLVVIPPSVLSWSPAARLPGLIATGNIALTGSGSPSNSTKVVGWNANQGAYSSGLQLTNEGDIATNSTGSLSLTGYNGVTVNGDASFGVGGTAGTCVQFNGGSTISGTTGPLSLRAANVIHRLPDGIPASSGAISLWGSNTQTISGIRRYDSLSM